MSERERKRKKWERESVEGMLCSLSLQLCICVRFVWRWESKQGSECRFFFHLCISSHVLPNLVDSLPMVAFTSVHRDAPANHRFHVMGFL